jgi:hypothetical protein
MVRPAGPSPLTGLQQTHLARLSSWNCLCDRPVFGAVGPCRTARALPHDGNMSAVQWGTVSTWVASVGTVAAVSLALWEARRDRKERLRRELRQQAVRISAWFVEMHKDPHGEDPRREDSRREAWLPPELRGRAADVELLNKRKKQPRRAIKYPRHFLAIPATAPVLYPKILDTGAGDLPEVVGRTAPATGRRTIPPARHHRSNGGPVSVGKIRSAGGTAGYPPALRAPS